jgi:hypothetical protein
MRDGGARRRHALAADHFGLAAPHIVHDRRHVAAGAVEMRLDHLQRKGGGHRGIEGIAALLQNPHADRSGDPMGRGDDAKSAFDLGTRGESVWVDIGHESSFVTCGHAAYRPACCAS